VHLLHFPRPAPGIVIEETADTDDVDVGRQSQRVITVISANA
jgi:hypothetical protein